MHTRSEEKTVMKRIQEEWNYMIREKKLIIMIASLFFLWNVLWQTFVEQYAEYEYWNYKIEKTMWFPIIVLGLICVILIYEIVNHFLIKRQLKVLVVWIALAAILGVLCGLFGELIYRIDLVSFSMAKQIMYYLSITNQQILRIVIIYYLFYCIYEMEKTVSILKEVILKVMFVSVLYWILDTLVNFNNVVNIICEDAIFILIIVMVGSRVKLKKKRG